MEKNEKSNMSKRNQSSGGGNFKCVNREYDSKMEIVERSKVRRGAYQCFLQNAASKFLGRVICAVIYILIFLMSLFFVPFTSASRELSKLNLLVILVFLGLILWVVKLVFVDGKIKMRRTKLDAAILIFIAISGISTILSIDPIVSFLGFYGAPSGSFLEILSLGVFYFIIVNNFSEPYSLVKVFLASSFLTVLGGFAFASGLMIKILPNDVIVRYPAFRETFFSAVSHSAGSFALFLAVSFALAAGVVFENSAAMERIKQNRRPVATAGNNKVNALFDAVAGLLIPLSVILFLLILPKIFIPQNVIGNLALDKKTSLEIVKNKITEGDVKKILIGSGPDTFIYDFSRYKPENFNQTSNWNLRFDKSESGVIEQTASLGFIGVAAHLFMIAIFLLAAFNLSKHKSFLFKAIFAGVLVLFLGYIFYRQDIALNFVFWTLLAEIAVLSRKSDETKSDKAGKLLGGALFSKKIFLKSSLKWAIFGCAVMIIFGAGFLIYQMGKFYNADIIYGKALENIQSRNIGLAGDQLLDAASLNPYRYEYRLFLAKLRLSEIDPLINRHETGKDGAKINWFVDSAIKETKAAIELSPNNVVPYEFLGIAYRGIDTFTFGASDWSKKYFSRALELEPANPVLLTELGKSELAELADSKEGAEQVGKIDMAISNFNKALDLKPDYFEASLQLALALEKKGELKAAIAQLDEIKNISKKELIEIGPEYSFNLGKFYYNDGRLDEAAAEFRIITEIYPNHSNAHYGLGLVYENMGMEKLALAEFKKVFDLNPERDDIMEKIRKFEMESLGEVNNQ